MTSFERALEFVLRAEGGYANNPADPGGATNEGVTQREYSAWRREGGHPTQDVKDLTPNKRNAVYFDDYWQAAGCQSIAWPLCLVQFDTAVNCGVQRAKGFLSACGGDVHAYLKKRRSYYLALVAIRPALKVFLKGWLNRMDLLEREVG